MVTRPLFVLKRKKRSPQSLSASVHGEDLSMDEEQTNCGGKEKRGDPFMRATVYCPLRALRRKRGRNMGEGRKKKMDE